MKKFWGAIESDKFADQCAGYAIEDEKLMDFDFEAESTNMILPPKGEFDKLLSDVKSFYPDKDVTIFQFYVPEDSLEQILQCAYDDINGGNSRPFSSFRVKVIESFEVKASL